MDVSQKPRRLQQTLQSMDQSIKLSKKPDLAYHIGDVFQANELTPVP